MSYSLVSPTALKICDMLRVLGSLLDMLSINHIGYCYFQCFTFLKGKEHFPSIWGYCIFFFVVWVWNLTNAGQGLYHWATTSPAPICGICILFLAIYYWTEQNLSKVVHPSLRFLKKKTETVNNMIKDREISFKVGALLAWFSCRKYAWHAF